MTPRDSATEKGLQAELTRGLRGRRALVTGAASGLGRAMADALTESGTTTFYADIDEGKATSAAKSAGTAASPLGIDVTDLASVRRAFGQATADGPLDILVCSAGISRANWIEEMQIEEWDAVLRTNLTGAFLCCQAAVPGMLQQKWGRIVNVASIAATWAPRPKRFDGGYNYSASKAGVLGMTVRLAVELAPHGITANCISPGIMQTPLTKHALEDPVTRKAAVDSIPMGRLGEPDDLCALLLFLCCDGSSYLTGQNIVIDGGYSLW